MDKPEQIRIMDFNLMDYDLVGKVYDEIFETLEKFDGENSRSVIESLNIAMCSIAGSCCDDHYQMKKWLNSILNETYDQILIQKKEKDEN